MGTHGSTVASYNCTVLYALEGLAVGSSEVEPVHHWYCLLGYVAVQMGGHWTFSAFVAGLRTCTEARYL